MTQLRLSIVGFGVVGQGLADLLVSKQELLRNQYGTEIRLISVASGRQGFIYREEGLDIPLLLELAAKNQPFTSHPDVKHWNNALEGLKATGGDVLVEATGTNLRDAEPGISHIRTALELGMHVITANKGPVALAANELQALARKKHVQLRLEATVMAGTPVLSTVLEGMAGAKVHAVRGILNGTTNYILTAMAGGRAYSEVLAEAQAQGYAEADPTADVEGYDVVAKALILSALVFGQTLKPEQVRRRGITGISREDIQHAQDEGKRIKLIATIRTSSNQPGAPVEASVEPIALPLSDPLARVDGVMNAISFQTDTLSEVTIIGPGAGRLQTGQGLLADLIAIAKQI
jgi:homoserine dehydrogenase